jgi:hypothetical protein
MRIKQLMVDFVLKALIPYVESQIHNLTEIVSTFENLSRYLYFYFFNQSITSTKYLESSPFKTLA